jgi:hypothetical protein
MTEDYQGADISAEDEILLRDPLSRAHSPPCQTRLDNSVLILSPSKSQGIGVYMFHVARCVSGYISAWSFGGAYLFRE